MLLDSRKYVCAYLLVAACAVAVLLERHYYMRYSLTTRKMHALAEARGPPSCYDVFIPPNDECPRFLTNKISIGAGFGHQFTELMFGMWAARLHGYSYVFEPFIFNDNARDDYSIMNEVLGLEAMFSELGAISRRSLDERIMKDEQWQTISGLPVNAPRQCKTVLAIGGYHHCTTAKTNGCFVAPENEFLFQRFAKCMRHAVFNYGMALKECVLVEPKHEVRQGERLIASDTVVVVWHIRVGDVAKHGPDDPFYERVLDTIKYVTHGFRIRIVLVGGGAKKDAAANTTTSVPIEYVKQISSIVNALWASTSAARVQAPAYTFRESFVAMMQADALIGSGSSLPQIAALLSGTPLFFNHESKHGFNYGAELLPENIDLATNGTVLDSLRRIKIDVFARINEGRKPCR